MQPLPFKALVLNKGLGWEDKKSSDINFRKKKIRIVNVSRDKGAENIEAEEFTNSLPNLPALP